MSAPLRFEMTSDGGSCCVAKAPVASGCRSHLRLPPAAYPATAVLPEEYCGSLLWSDATSTCRWKDAVHDTAQRTGQGEPDPGMAADRVRPAADGRAGNRAARASGASAVAGLPARRDRDRHVVVLAALVAGGGARSVHRRVRRPGVPPRDSVAGRARSD